MLAPVIDFRLPASLSSPLTSVTFTGTGPNGSILIGGTSDPITLRVYNNYAGTGGIADATNCELSSYDTSALSSLGVATITPVTTQWLQSQVNNFNGITTGSDTQFYPIGGTTKHTIPTNSGVIPGSAANYVTVTYQIVVPSNATGAAYNQGIFIEYNYNF